MTTLPAWIANISDPVIQKDATALNAAGIQTIATDLSLMNDVAAELSANNSTLTAAQLSGLQAIANNVPSPAPAYLASSLLSYVVFSGANGDYLQAGATAAQVTQIADGWFQGATSLALQTSDATAGATTAAKALPLFGASGLPSVADIHQGALADSTLLAAAMDLANTNPQALQARFVDLGNGLVAVNLHYQWYQWVTVTDQLPVSAAGALIYSGSAENWSNLLEKAAAQLNVSGTGQTGFFGDNTGLNYGDLNGISAVQSFTALNGSSAFQIAAYASSDPQWNSYKLLFENALSAKDSLILSELGTSKDSSGNLLFTGSQSYAVLGYDAQTGDFILRNPRSDQGATQQFEASMADIAAVQGSFIIDNNQSGVTVATALAAPSSTAPLVVQDAAATVFAHLDALQAMVQAGTLSSIGLTDSGAVSATITQTQFTNDSGILANITGNISLSITNASAAAAASLIMQANVTQVSVSDTAAAIGANLDSLQSLVNLTQCNAITITDGNSVPVSLSQLTNDQAALNAIQGTYSLAVSGVGTTAVAATLALPHVATVSVSDTAADISGDLDSLQSLVASGKCTAITVSDGNPLSVTAAQLTSDSAALGAISGSYSLIETAPTSSATIVGYAKADGFTLSLSGDASQYTITPAGDGVHFTLSGGGVTDTVSDVQALKFADFTEIVATAPGSGSTVTTGNITELYSAVLAREPDVGGLTFYQNFLTAHPSTPLQQFAQWFLGSGEYTGNSAHDYAATSAGDAQFITDSYQSLLNRTPTASEVSFYQANVMAPAETGLAAGSQAFAQAQIQAHALMLVYFSNSAEFLGDVQITAQHPASASHWLVLI